MAPRFRRISGGVFSQLEISCIELPTHLKLPGLLVAYDLDPHRGRHIQRAVVRCGLLPRVQRVAVVAKTPTFLRVATKDRNHAVASAALVDTLSPCSSIGV